MKLKDIKCTKCGSSDLQPSFEIDGNMIGEGLSFPDLVTGGSLLCNSCGASCEINKEK